MRGRRSSVRHAPVDLRRRPVRLPRGRARLASTRCDALLPALAECSRGARRCPVQLLLARSRTPQLLELPPLVGHRRPAVDAARPDAARSRRRSGRETRGGRPECLLSVGETATTRRFRTVASQTIEGRAAQGERGLIVGRAEFDAGSLRGLRWWSACANETSLSHCSKRRQRRSARSSNAISCSSETRLASGRSCKASERRLSRLGFDLHDGALQHVAALAADLRRLRPQLASTAAGTQLEGAERRSASSTGY